MPAFKQRLARIGATAGVLVASTAAFMAVGGVGVASAAPHCATTPTAIVGKGSSLQRVAQENWHTGYPVKCPGASVTYTVTSSGDGLAALGFTGTGITSPLQGFIGTDDGPNAGQIKNAETASKTKPIIVPVAQTSIAVVINPPGNNGVGATECKLKSGAKLSYAQLGEIFGGKAITTWAQLKTANVVEGEGCTGNLTRVVRSDASGTTYQFKNYLAVLQKSFSGGAMGCELSGGFNDEKEEALAGKSNQWINFRHVEAPNLLWPTPANCSGSTAVTAVKGGGEVAKTVKNTNGTIGYAALPDAEAQGAEMISLQDTTLGGTASPVSGTEANCGGRVYTVPTGASGGIAIDWSGVFGAVPTIGGGKYPLCTLTYDVAWDSYTPVKSGSEEYAANVGDNVRGFIEGYVLTTGQNLLPEHFYQKLPTGEGTSTNVLLAAEQAAQNIG
jgi:ABC-type phosphate transport system substrate-binding protein